MNAGRLLSVIRQTRIIAKLSDRVASLKESAKTLIFGRQFAFAA